jgi:hypothetical protein
MRATAMASAFSFRRHPPTGLAERAAGGRGCTVITPKLRKSRCRQLVAVRPPNSRFEQEAAVSSANSRFCDMAAVGGCRMDSRFYKKAAIGRIV